LKKIVFLILALAFLLQTVKADSLNLDATSAILIDKESGKVLYEKSPDEKLPMASMTKIMSMLLIMENIESGNLNYNDKVIISKNASGMGGSQVFLQEGEEYKVEDLLKCIAVSSANDAVVAMAEKISGSEANFVELMNNKARELGLKNEDLVKLKIETDKGGEMEAFVKVSSNGFYEIHIDTDDANCFLLKTRDEVEIIR